MLVRENLPAANPRQQRLRRAGRSGCSHLGFDALNIDLGHTLLLGGLRQARSAVQARLSLCVCARHPMSVQFLGGPHRSEGLGRLTAERQGCATQGIGSR